MKFSKMFRFRELGKRVFYVTNNSTKHRREYKVGCKIKSDLKIRDEDPVSRSGYGSGALGPDL